MSGEIIYNDDFYALGVMGKFARPGAVRISVISTENDLTVTGFIYDNKFDIIVINTVSKAHSFTLKWRKYYF